jgi:hypothetical protein
MGWLCPPFGCAVYMGQVIIVAQKIQPLSLCLQQAWNVPLDHVFDRLLQVVGCDVQWLGPKAVTQTYESREQWGIRVGQRRVSLELWVAEREQSKRSDGMLLRCRKAAVLCSGIEIEPEGRQDGG